MTYEKTEQRKKAQVISRKENEKMKRRLVLCMIVVAVLSLGGCSQKNTQNGEAGSAAGTVSPSPVTDTGTTNAGTNAGTAAETPVAGAATGQTDQNQTASVQNGTDGTNRIAEEDARNIALSHAGFTADQVTFIKSELEQNDSGEHYDVEFYIEGGKEYDYEIDPYTGEILEYDEDAEGHKQTDGTTDASADGERLTEEQAKKIVLDKVPGATEQDIKEFKEDYDDDRLQYEGKIHYEKKEYEFEIDGYNGEILEWDEETLRDGVS